MLPYTLVTLDSEYKTASTNNLQLVCLRSHFADINVRFEFDEEGT